MENLFVGCQGGGEGFVGVVEAELRLGCEIV